MTNDQTPQENGQQEYTFITQEVKPKKKRKYLKKLISGALLVLPLAILFGFLAFLSFRITQKYFYPDATTVTEPFHIDTTENSTTVTETTTEEPTTEEDSTEGSTDQETTTEEHRDAPR